MNNKRAYIFLTDGVEETEAITTIDMLRRADIGVLSVSVTEKKLITGSHNIQFNADMLFDEADFSDGDMIILPGGPGTGNLKKCSGLISLIKKYYDEKKYIAAICAAPTILHEMGLLEGKTAVCYPSFSEEFTGVNVSSELVVEDGLIITSKGPATAMHFSVKIIEALKGTETAKAVCEKFLFTTASV